MREAQRIADQFKRIYNDSPWYGTPLLKLLKGVSAEKAAAHPLPNCHSIWELVLHMAGWERVVARRISESKGPAEANWPKVTDTSERAWKAAVKRLVDSNRELLKVIANLSDEEIAFSKRKGSPGRKYVQAHGILQHTMYHTGQIAMLKKALRRKETWMKPAPKKTVKRRATKKAAKR